MKKGNFYQTTALVTLFSVAERALGFLYRVVLARLLGAQGLGVYQIALSHFALFRTLGGGGLPVAASRLTAKARAEGKGNGNAFGGAAILSLAITLPITLIACLLPHTPSALKILLVGLSFTCVYAVVKGFFWGQNKFLAPSALEMGEEIVTVVAGVLLLRTFGQGGENGANLAALACVVACVLSCLVSLALTMTLPKADRKIRLSLPLLKEVAASALPVTGMRAGGTLLSSAVAVLFPAMLIKSGLTQNQATAAFGVATGMALPLLSMPLTLVGSFALVLMPKLAEDYYQGNRDRLYRNIERGLSCALLVACALLPFFAVLGENLGLLTYDNLLAGQILEKSCFLLLPMSFTVIATTALNSMGFEKKTLLFFLFGGAGMLLCVLILPRFLGVYAFSVGLCVQYLISGALSAWALFRRRKPSKFFLRKALLALLFILPVLFLGEGCLTLFSRFFGVGWNMALTAGIMATATVALYLTFGLFSAPFLGKIFAKR